MIRKNVLAGVGSVVLAFLASQHHTLHMLLIAAGLGGVGAGLLEGFPVIRWIMLLTSAAIAGKLLLQLRQPRLSRTMRVANTISAVLTILLIAWSIYSVGL